MKRLYPIIFLVLMMATAIGQISFIESANIYNIDHSYNAITTGGGISFYDFNQDGLDDITLASEEGRPIAFYINNGTNFELASTLVGNLEDVKQILWADFDNDGDPDLYLAAYEGYNRLYENTGNLEFVDITETCGFPTDLHRGYGACWGDYNRDGWLDLYFSSRKIPGVQNGININRLFRNNADGTFEEVTESANAGDLDKTPFCAAFIDYNNDKWPDIYIANDKQKGNTLLANNKEAAFSDVSEISRTDLAMNSMCVTPGDINDDGLTDIYITNTPEGNKCLLNKGPNGNDDVTFNEISENAGISFNGIGWGSQFFDADNDGDLDLYVSGAITGAESISSLFYEHNSNLQFSTLPASSMKGDTVASYSNAIGDLNQDGLLDIVVQNGTPVKFHIWENQSASANNWVKVHLEGVLSNRDAIGTKIECYYKDNYHSAYTTCGTGFLGQNTSFKHFGLGENDVIDSLRITWPTGHIDRLYTIDANQIIYIVEGQSTGGDIDIDPDIDIIMTSSNNLQNTNTSPLPFNITPNPSSDVIQIQNTSNSEDFCDIIIRSSSGKTYMRLNNIQFSNAIYVDELLSGVYWIEIITKRSRSTLKFIKL